MFQWYLLFHTMKESVWYINNLSIFFRKTFPEYLQYIFSKYFSRFTRKTALLSRLRNLSKWVDAQYPIIEINQKTWNCSKCPLQTRNFSTQNLWETHKHCWRSKYFNLYVRRIYNRIQYLPSNWLRVTLLSLTHKYKKNFYHMSLTRKPWEKKIHIKFINHSEQNE